MKEVQWICHLSLSYHKRARLQIHTMCLVHTFWSLVEYTAGNRAHQVYPSHHESWCWCMVVFLELSRASKLEVSQGTVHSTKHPKMLQTTKSWTRDTHSAQHLKPLHQRKTHYQTNLSNCMFHYIKIYDVSSPSRTSATGHRPRGSCSSSCEHWIWVTWHGTGDPGMRDVGRCWCHYCWTIQASHWLLGIPIYVRLILRVKNLLSL